MAKDIVTDKVYERAIEEFGEDHQLNIVKEELAELIVAVNQWQRKRVGQHIVIEEIADVKIMISQLLIILKNNPTERSLNPYKLLKFAEDCKLKRLENIILKSNGKKNSL